jgi:hypothetical protein
VARTLSVREASLTRLASQRESARQRQEKRCKCYDRGQRRARPATAIASGMSPDDDDPIEREHARLIAEHRELRREHEHLEAHPEDTPGHIEHSRKLRAHIEALHAHLALLRDK